MSVATFVLLVDADELTDEELEALDERYTERREFGPCGDEMPEWLYRWLGEGQRTLEEQWPRM